MERWSVIPQAPDYAVSNMGQVRRNTASRLGPAGRILKPAVTAKRYFRITLRSPDGSVRSYFVQRLVAAAFLPPPPGEGYTVAHEDGNPQNNCVENLSWKTHIENNRDRIRHGTMPRGERHPATKLKNDDVRKIRHLVSLGFLSFEDISKRYAVSATVISNIAHGRTWSHLP